MAIAYRSGSTAGNSSGANLTINKPNGTTDGDILICSFYQEIGATAVTPPSGWELILTQANSSANAWVSTYWKRASSEPASWTWTHASTWRVGAVAAFSGCLASGTPYEAATGNAASQNAVVAASITTTVADTMAAVGMGNYGGNDITAGSSGYTIGPTLGGCEVAYHATPNTGATGTKTFSDDASSAWATVHLALKPATGGEPPAAGPGARATLSLLGVGR